MRRRKMTNQHVEEKRWAFRSDFNMKKEGKKKKRGQCLMESSKIWLPPGEIKGITNENRYV